MKVLRFCVAGLLALAAAAGIQHARLTPGPSLPATAPETLRIATWNVHYIRTGQAEGRWGLSGWEARKATLDETFGRLSADLVAFQEMESFSGGNDDTTNLARSWLLERNPGYAAAAIGDWRSFPSTQPILYRRDRLELLEQGWFFFSDTPDVIYSRSFDGRYPAFASWAQFHDRTEDARFRVLNLHFDAGSRENRRLSAELVSERIAPWIAGGETVVVAGDFNALHGSRLHRRLEEAGVRFPKVPDATFHFDMGLHLLPAIDHIGLAGSARVARGPYVVAAPDEVPASDHWPLVIDMSLAASEAP
jgi:endonuclease/exonuclease/phosphatase family metal-dependent hydrolase